MAFERSLFVKMQLWIVKHFFLHKKVPLIMNQKIWKNCMLSFITTGTFLFNYSELHFSEVTSYKIQTLDLYLKISNSFPYKIINKFVWTNLKLNNPIDQNEEVWYLQCKSSTCDFQKHLCWMNKCLKCIFFIAKLFLDYVKCAERQWI